MLDGSKSFCNEYDRRGHSDEKSDSKGEILTSLLMIDLAVHHHVI